MADELARVQIYGYSVKIEQLATKFQLEICVSEINEKEAKLLFEFNEDIVNLKC
jgi:hypothetical protein